VPDDQLPVILPDDLIPDGSGNPLAKDERFWRTALPTLQRASTTRNRHDGHLSSTLSWYFMRYCSPDAKRCHGRYPQ
jgi:leucyl-tRNA synthetase